MNNIIIFQEIIAKSPIELKGFYANVFDWQFTPVSESPELIAIKNSVIQPFGLPDELGPAGLLTQQSNEPILNWRIVDASTPDGPFFEITTILTDFNAMPQPGIAKVAERPGFSKFNGFYIQVKDVADTLEMIEQHRGEILMPPVNTALGSKNVDTAMFCDPQDNRIGLISFCA
ncbi:VOC family protein [Alteromonas sp. a30]|uniref:VOC family protein n=1 Tax=Alteromonas sp. a30 TaxID=2730917 RepID=UPI00227EF709|nr:hypothetical protein [Alteromonas sp. a30]MCY7297255.1 hypothetical protein [Alteromonas sp. a30]